jgi:hypothetical protein
MLVLGKSGASFATFIKSPFRQCKKRLHPDFGNARKPKQKETSSTEFRLQHSGIIEIDHGANYQLLVLQRRGERALVHLLRVLSSDGIRVIGNSESHGSVYGTPTGGRQNADGLLSSSENGEPETRIKLSTHTVPTLALVPCERTVTLDHDVTPLDRYLVPGLGRPLLDLEDCSPRLGKQGQFTSSTSSLTRIRAKTRLYRKMVTLTYSYFAAESSAVGPHGTM